MPIVRTTCPTCDVVIVESPSLTVRLHSTHAGSEAAFVCPECGVDVVHPLDDRMVPVLIGAGCPVDDGTGPDISGPSASGWHPAFGLDITEAEIADFVAGLDDHDWFDELAH